MAETQVRVTIENLAPEAGTFLTPFWVGFHDGDFDTYDRGRPISPGLESLVEDGETAALSEEFAVSGDGTIDGTIAGGEGIEGPIDPGETITETFILDSEADTNQFFSYASMIIPSNDAFISNGNPSAFQIFDEEGNFIGTDFIVAGSSVLDGGTEVNDELAENTAFFSQAELNTGEDENGVVTPHPGFIEDGRILSEDGTTEGAPAAFNNADFTAEGYQVARITVSLDERSEEPPLPLAAPVTITSTLDGEQEVEAGDEDATGNSTLTLNNAGNALEYSLTVNGLDFGANGLIEGGAQTEETSDDVTRLHIHNAPRGENGDIVFSLFDTVAPELGNVLEIPGNQDEDLTVTANDDGSVTLTGAWEETDPASTALSEFVPEIREGAEAEDEDLNFYWNVHTEEFPGGAIRGQLVVNNEEDNPPEPEPLEVRVTIENLAPEAGTFLTPFWVGFHDGDFDTYDRGRPISPGLESLVEDGETAALSEEFAISGDGTLDGTITGGEGIEGPIDPGETVTETFTLDSNDDTNQFFSYASMIIPSNDAFVSNGNPMAHSLFDEEGNFIGADFIVAGSQVLDGGTEVNDELAENTAFFSQAELNTGEDENGVVTPHPGFIEDGRILSEDGTTEGAPAAFNNADFTADGYQVARVTVSVVDDPVSITSTLDGEQEVGAGDEDATGTSTLTLNDTGNSLEYSLTVTGLDFGASGLIEGGAQTEDTSDDVTRLHIHNAPRGENGDIVFSLFDTVTPELGDVLDIQGNQDEDLTVTANDDGSVTLTGFWEGTDPSSTDLGEFVSEIRDAEAEEDLDLYWNVHTEEFPAGAIRGQLVVEEEVIEEPVFITSTLDGEQEVEAGDEDATGTSTLTLNDTGNSLEYSLTVTGLDFGANGLIEGGAQTEDTSDDVTRLHIHNAPRGENGDIVFSLFDTVTPDDLGNVLEIPGNQDEDLTVTANDDGSVTLTGVWEGTDPSSTDLGEFVSEIRDTEAGEDLDLYWNVHTEEFPAGAIRGQLVVEEEVIEEPVNITSTLDGEQEVEAGDEDATGTSTLTLNDTGDSLEYSLTVSGLDFGANGLIEGGAQTEDTSDDVTRLHIHNAPRGENGDIVFSLFDTVTPELGDVLDIQGNQDEDLTVTANDDGSVTLTGVWEETDPSSTDLSEFVSEIRDAEAGEDLDLYWNVHTEEFPAGAIRGQLVVEEEEQNTIELFRFRNTNFDTGTYIFVREGEREAIEADPNLNEIFELEGVQEDGSITPAFTASATPEEGLIPQFRFQSNLTPGTFVFVGEQERQSINENFAEEFTEEGLAFYVRGAGSGLGTEFNRFQNNQNNTFLFAGPGETESIENNPDFSNIFDNQGVAFESLD
ncbi:CHRD domain-containing protein (modular protein) [Hyella patelloides LEGE 07179]|uniref:CHRD domain-containing protein (Modular protein) n=1 Tax=Hyella patelloides LEGE 07179 TaxID=945734 RepID=A0A563VX97_9CYAN|nr:CHRD domain-containing protein [Hyella patelloides]VEP16072.1 CHRD domain-containing protein (modular protein) [Hyella patelloides LEGE 07179]